MTPELLTQLTSQVHHNIVVLEHLFGPCDPNYVFGSIHRSTHPGESPQTMFQGKNMHDQGIVDIQISPYCYDENCVGWSTWQIAHECVHLIDPCQKGEANVLEEGLATWFQDEFEYQPSFTHDCIRNASHGENYATAKALVLGCMPYLVPVIRQARSTGMRLMDFKPKRLNDLGLLSDLDDSVLQSLCEKFKH